MQKNPEFGVYLEESYPGIKEFVRPGKRSGFKRATPADQGLTWHHHPYDEGILGLTPREHHSSPGPVQESLHPEQKGGMERWGGGRKK